MLFNSHSDLRDQHAFLSPSNYHWLNYTGQKLEARYFTVSSARRGTDLHNLAKEAIRLGVKLARSNKSLSTYVNDAISYKMSVEQILYYSPNCFGTCDAICFRRNVLRIFELKTGITATSEKQLEIYGALFCLEYDVDPYSIEYDLRIYQRDEIRHFEPYSETIASIMETIVEFDHQLELLRQED